MGVITEPPPLNLLDARYRRWRDANPAVFAIFYNFAAQLLARNRPFGIRLLSNRVRWEVHMHIEKDDEGFRINNNLTPYLARDLMRRMPGLKKLIQTRHVDGERR